MVRKSLFQKETILKLCAVVCAVVALVFGTLRVMIWLMAYLAAEGFTSGGTVVIGGADGLTAVFVTGNVDAPMWIGVGFAAVALAITLYLMKGKKQSK